MRGVRRAVLGLLLLAVVVGAFALRPRLPAAERGRRLAQSTGCFACHGEGGLQGAYNPGRHDRTVPGFQGDVMMYAKTPAEIREWIHDGVNAKRARSETWREQRRRGVLKMPAFGRRLSDRQVDDLVAYVTAVAGMPEPEEELAKRGLERAEALGCVGCHGAGGRLALPNPRSLKGYVPAWDSADFADLVQHRAQFDEWVERGVSRDLEGNPVAGFFLRRAVLRMPAYRDRLESGDLDALWAYVQWLRALPDSSARATRN